MQTYVQPLLDTWGLFRPVHPTGTRNCKTVPELRACEKISLHAPSGLLYLACSTPQDRLNWVNWLPGVAERTTYDYLATYDASTNTVTRLEVADGASFDAKRSISLHGLDVVTSAHDPDELFVYLVNHRMPASVDAFVRAGADSVIEIFKTRVGSSTLYHLHTFRDEKVIITPNDVSGSPDGKSVYYTNSEGKKLSWQFTLERVSFLFKSDSSVGFCHVDTGCFLAAEKMPGNNGIVRAPTNNTVYVANSVNGGIRVMETLKNGTLVLKETIPTELGIDNLTLDENGHIYAAAFPKSLDLNSCLHDFTFECRSPSAVYAATTNATGASTAQIIFEDDGSLVSTMTAVVHDSRHGRLFMHGLLAPWLTVCKL
ncbi:calcium-dependent phosphotriesterase [Auricularia subglabra TFB-10046 SS5]|nr:calcium-dependent phosphotriesterase [Auricularia subglabra TFB-10046 SS5]